jgi:protein-S-isoprenylcysteine O-methyltransferase Ste14
MEPDVAIRWVTLALLAFQTIYWEVSERRADAAKPKQRAASRTESRLRLILQLFVLFMALQLLGLMNVVSFKPYLPLELIGVFFAAYGLYVCVTGRRNLGDNWAHGVEFQIKAGHELVTTGIYRHIRHPIYAGLGLGIVGVELAAHSYLAIVLTPLIFLAGYYQSRREEAILLEHFGESYRQYMAHTAMFIPMVW